MDIDLSPGREFWKTACECISQPLAIISPDNSFIWLNKAFEDTIGYSSIELKGMSWLDITVSKDVAGDLKSVNAVLDGTIDNYSLYKTYRHKSGFEIPINLSVWRFPKDHSEAFLCFLVEACPEKISLTEFTKTIVAIEERVKRMENNSKNPTNFDINLGTSAGGDVVGRDKNSTNTIKFIAGMGIVGLIIFAWLAYYIVSIINQNPNPSPPPSVNTEARIINYPLDGVDSQMTSERNFLI